MHSPTPHRTALAVVLALFATPHLQAYQNSPLKWKETEKSSGGRMIVFEAVNPTQTPIRIVRITPSCYCLSPTPSVWTIPPGGELSLKVPISDFRGKPKNLPQLESTYKILVQTDSDNETSKFWQDAFWAAPGIEPSLSSTKLLMEGKLQQRDPSQKSPLHEFSKKYQEDIRNNPTKAEDLLNTLSSYKVPYTDTLTATYNKQPQTQGESPKKKDQIEGFAGTFELVKEQTAEAVQTKEYYPNPQGPEGWISKVTLRFYPNESSIRTPVRTYLTEITRQLLHPPDAYFSPYTDNPELQDSIIQTIQTHADSQTGSPMDKSLIVELNRFFYSEELQGAFSISYSMSGQDWNSLKGIPNLNPQHKEAAENHLKSLLDRRRLLTIRRELFEFDKKTTLEKFPKAAAKNSPAEKSTPLAAPSPAL